MTYQEWGKNIEKTIELAVDLNKGKIMVDIAQNAFDLINQRILKTGVNAQDKSFAPYSTKETLIGRKSFFKSTVGNAVLGSKSKRKALEWRTIGNGAEAKHLAILPGGYAKIRQLQGRQTQFVDFSLQGRMWSDIHTISSAADHQNGVAVIGAVTKENKDKLSGNTARRGNILDLSNSELQKLTNLMGMEIFKVVKT